MSLIYEVFTIGLIYLAGTVLACLLPLPGSLISLVIFFILLLLKVLKEEKYTALSALILRNLAFFFIVPAVKILDSMDTLSGNIFKLISIIVLSNILVMIVSGKVVQFFMKKEDTDD